MFPPLAGVDADIAMVGGDDGDIGVDLDLDPEPTSYESSIIGIEGTSADPP